MFTYTFTGGKPLYLQLYDALKADILAGRLATGTKLPSKRAAAKNLGVSVITVENAYAALQSEGYLYSLPKKGFYVSTLESLAPAPPALQEPTHLPLPQKAAYRFDFASNGIIPENFPFTVWARLMRATFRGAKEALMLASPAGGVPALREAICRHLKQFRNMEVAPEQVIIGAGTEYLYSLIVQLLGREKTYAVQNPGYPKLLKIYRCIGVKCVCVEEDREGMRTDALLQSGADIAHISPSHHFPSGTLMSAARRHELLALASQKEGRYIIEDDYDSEFRLAGKPLPSLQSLDSAGKVIYVNTFTKSLSPTIRISYMVLPPHLARRFYATLGFYACTVSTFEQATLAAFIAEGYFEKHINRMRNYYKKTRDELLEAIRRSPLHARTRVSEEEAGLHFLLTLQTSLPDAVLKARAEEKGIHLAFLSEYYLEKQEQAPEHILLMNYSALRREDIPAAVAALEEVMEVNEH